MKDLIVLLAFEQALSRYARGLDERKFDDRWVALFASDAVVELPPGRCRGSANLAHFHQEVLAPFVRTHHMTTDHLIEVNGDEATGRANLHVTHAIADSTNMLIVDGIIVSSLCRQAEGWVFRWLKIEPVFRDGMIAQ
jgi:3-phenylpropionate/cinnamic acid dioxygenase small subunit